MCRWCSILNTCGDFICEIGNRSATVVVEVAAVDVVVIVIVVVVAAVVVITTAANTGCSGNTQHIVTIVLWHLKVRQHMRRHKWCLSASRKFSAGTTCVAFSVWRVEAYGINACVVVAAARIVRRWEAVSLWESVLHIA